MHIFKAITPLYYTVHSRLKTPLEFFSWVIVYVVPVFLICLRFSGAGPLPSLLQAAAALTALFSLYEAGYMANDVFTVKREKRPTLRIGGEERRFLGDNYTVVLCIRVCIALGIVAALAFSAAGRRGALHVTAFSLGLSVTAIMFTVHNRLRSRWNIPTYFCLSSMKYLTPLLLFREPSDGLIPLLLTVTLFPLPRSLEDSTKKRYGLRFMQAKVGSNDLFRVRYYALHTLLLLVATGCAAEGGGLRGELLFFTGLSVYFLLYRVLVLLLLGNSSKLRRAFRKT